MLWPSFWNPLSLLERLHSIEDYQHSGKLSAESSFSKAKYELKGSVFLDYDDDKTGSSFQTVKLLQISQISKPTFRFFLIMNLWLAGNKSKKASSRASLFLLQAAAGNSSCCLFGSRDLREFATGLSPQITIQFSLCFPFLVAC